MVCSTSVGLKQTNSCLYVSSPRAILEKPWFMWLLIWGHTVHSISRSPSKGFWHKILLQKENSPFETVSKRITVITSISEVMPLISSLSQVHRISRAGRDAQVQLLGLRRTTWNSNPMSFITKLFAVTIKYCNIKSNFL